MSLLQSNKPRPKSVHLDKHTQMGAQQLDVVRNLPSPTTERVLDALPGVGVWLAFIASFIFSIMLPRLMIFGAMSLAIYCTVRFTLASGASLVGWGRIYRWQRRNWYEEYLTVQPSTLYCVWEDVHHVVLIPNFNEPLNVLRESLNQLAKWDYAKQQMTVVLAMESAEQNNTQKAQSLQAEYKEQFAYIFFTSHPAGLKDEIQCKSANLAWAGRWLRRNLSKLAGIKPENIVVTTMDVDTHWHTHYFSAVTYFFVTNPQRHTTFWQAPIRYHGNVWQINPLVRLINAYSSAFELAYLTAGWWLALPISSYSMSWSLLEKSGFWDTNVIADEWHMFVKSFFATGASLTIQPIYLPFSAFATTGETVFLALKNRYTQTLRHAWGSKEIGYIISRIVETSHSPLHRSLRLLFRVAHDLLLSSIGWVLLSIGSFLPFIFHPALLTDGIFSSNMISPIVLFQASAVVIILLGIVFWRIDLSVRPERQIAMTRVECFWSVASLFLLPVLTMVFVTFPVIHAQTLLMIGATIPFQVSRKL